MHYDWGLRAVKSLLRQASVSGSLSNLRKCFQICFPFVDLQQKRKRSFYKIDLFLFVFALQAGALKAKEKDDEDESVVLCRALRDFNLPKITTQEQRQRSQRFALLCIAFKLRNLGKNQRNKTENTEATDSKSQRSKDLPQVIWFSKSQTCILKVFRCFKDRGG